MATPFVNVFVFTADASTVRVAFSSLFFVIVNSVVLIVIFSKVLVAEVIFCPSISRPLAVPKGKGIPFLLETVPKFAELPPLLPPLKFAVVCMFFSASVASGQPSLSESVSK